MSSDEWEELGQDKGDTSYIKWDQPGVLVEGIWKGVGQGDYGAVGRLHSTEGVLQFSLPTVLAGKLEDVQQGDLVRIKFTGTETNASGRDYKMFSVHRFHKRAQL